MKVYQLIQTLCRLDPQTEILISLDGFPATTKVALERCYDDWEPGKPETKRVLLTTAEICYKNKRKTK